MLSYIHLLIPTGPEASTFDNLHSILRPAKDHSRLQREHLRPANMQYVDRKADTHASRRMPRHPPSCHDESHLGSPINLEILQHQSTARTDKAGMAEDDTYPVLNKKEMKSCCWCLRCEFISDGNRANDGDVMGRSGYGNTAHDFEAVGGLLSAVESHMACSYLHGPDCTKFFPLASSL